MATLAGLYKDASSQEGGAVSVLVHPLPLCPIANGTSSPGSGRSQSPAGANNTDVRGRSSSQVGGVQMRNKPVRSGPGASVRRSRNLESRGENDYQ